MSMNPLRNVPSVSDLLESPPLRTLLNRISHSAVVSTVRTVLDEVRNEVQNAAAEKTLPSVSELAERIARRVVETEKLSLEPAVNATGVLFADDSGRAPLAAAAVEAIAAAARDFAGQELDPTTGRRSAGMATVEGLLKELTGAEAALVVNSGAGATLLALAALATGREVIVSRGDLIDLGPTYRLPRVIAAGGALLREVGAVNRTGVDDYAEAIRESTAALMRVYTGHCVVAEHTVGVPLDDLVELARKHRLPLIHHLGVGSLVDLGEFGLPDVPVVSQSVKAGTDLVLASGAKLLGGPQCGIILGRRSLVERIGQHAMARALAVGKLTLAGLAATLRLYQDPKKAQHQVPLLSLLATSAENLSGRAERLAPQLAATEAVAEARCVAAVSPVGGESMPILRLPTHCVAVRPEGMSLDRLSAALRQGAPSVIGRTEDDRLLLDLRSVIPCQDQELVEAFTAVGEAKKA